MKIKRKNRDIQIHYKQSYFKKLKVKWLTQVTLA